MVKSTRPSSTHIAGQLPTEEMNPKDTSSPKISHVVLSNFSATLESLGEKLESEPNAKWMIGRVMKGDHKGEFTLRKKGFATFWARLTGNVDFKHLTGAKKNDGIKEVLDCYVRQNDPINQNEKTGELNVAGRLLRGRFRQIGRRLISDEAKVKAHETYSNILEQVFSGDTAGISAADLQQIAQDCLINLTLTIPSHYETAYYNNQAEILNMPHVRPYDLQGLKHLRVLYQLIKKQNRTGDSSEAAIGAFQRLRNELTTFNSKGQSIHLYNQLFQESQVKGVNKGTLVAKWRVKCDAAEAICSPDFQPHIELLKKMIDGFSLKEIGQPKTTQESIEEFQTLAASQSKKIRARRVGESRKISDPAIAYDIKGLRRLKALHKSLKKEDPSTESKNQLFVIRDILTPRGTPKGANPLIAGFEEESTKEGADAGAVIAKWRAKYDAAKAICTSRYQPILRSLKKKIDAFERVSIPPQALSPAEVNATLKVMKRDISKALNEKSSHFERHIGAIKEAYSSLPAEVKEAGVPDYINTYKDLVLVRESMQDLIEAVTETEMEHSIERGRRLIAVAQALSDPEDAGQLMILKSIINGIERKLINATVERIQAPMKTSPLSSKEIKRTKTAIGRYTKEIAKLTVDLETTPVETLTRLRSNIGQRLKRCSSSEDPEIEALALELESLRHLTEGLIQRKETEK